MNSLFHRLHHAFHHHHHAHAAGFGHRGFHGMGGRHGFSADPSGMDIDGLSRGRKLSSADLQLLLLALLAERPSYGYELIKALDERSAGYYSPSPGMVYPALTYLEEIGHTTVESQGARKLYAITEMGSAHLESLRANADALLEQLAWIGQRMAQMRSAMAGTEADDTADFDTQAFAGRGRGRHAGTPVMRAARHNLKAALMEKSGASAAEQERIAQILERATAEIRGNPTGN